MCLLLRILVDISLFSFLAVHKALPLRPQLAALVYLLPLADGLQFGVPLLVGSAWVGLEGICAACGSVLFFDVGPRLGSTLRPEFPDR